ncbi:MAG: 2-phospho-L-lactate transferase [Solirubrobacterales bacterium]|nr:2-phospho-L-lactate transferase [Solirubrobacterales bacterium]
MSTVVVLAGGTGGAKLARGMLDVVGDELVVVANTADDVEVHCAYVCPDPDLCAFWLADRIDSRGWGLDGDTFETMDGLRELGVDVWFNLGDRDLAIGLDRSRRLAEGQSLTQAIAAMTDVLGVPARVLPMCDDIVRTRVKAADRWWPFQEFMIRHGAEGPIEEVAFGGIEGAAPTEEVLEAVAAARVIVVGPSNPVISVRPILDLPGLAEALAGAPAPVVAVSPIVGGEILKGPTRAFMDFAEVRVDASGVADYYGTLLDGMVCDEPEASLPVPVHTTHTRMDTAADRERVARETLDFALGLA